MKFTSVLVASFLAGMPFVAQAEVDTSQVVYEQKLRVQVVHELYLFACFGLSGGYTPIEEEMQKAPDCDRADKAYVREQDYLFFLIYGRLPFPEEDPEEMTQ